MSKYYVLKFTKQYLEPKIYPSFSVGPTFGKIIYQIASLNLHENILEVGSLNGYSTYSFISAINDGGKFDFTSCDLRTTENVKKMANSCKRKIRIINDRSSRVIGPQYDLIFLDGAHNYNIVGEEIHLLLKFKTKSIIAHDTFIFAPSFMGAVLLHQVFENHRDYQSVCCNKKISTKLWDHTNFGLSFFTRDNLVYQQVKPMFDRLDCYSEQTLVSNFNNRRRRQPKSFSKLVFN